MEENGKSLKFLLLGDIWLQGLRDMSTSYFPFASWEVPNQYKSRKPHGFLGTA